MKLLLVGLTIFLSITTRFTHCQVYSLEGQPETGYYLSVRLGTPPQEFKVLIDSGSSNFAVAGVHFPSISNYSYFDKALSRSFRDINTEVGVTYVEGSWSGRVGKDNFSFVSDNNDINPLSTFVYVSLMEKVTNGFFKTSTGWVGVLGMGYPALAKPDSSILPVMDSLVAAGVTADKFGLQLCGPEPGTDGDLVEMGGKMSLGSGMPLLPTSSDGFKYAAITKKSFYEIILTNIKVGTTSLGLRCSAFNKEFSIIDSGTTELVFNEETYAALLKLLKDSSGKLSGKTIPDSFWAGDTALGWGRGSQEEFRSFQNLEISLAMPDSEDSELSIVIPPQLYLKKESDKSIKEVNYCATTDCVWYKLGIKKSPANSLSGSVLGMMLFKGYTVEFDRSGGKVGFAPSACSINGLDNSSEVLKVARKTRSNSDNCTYSDSTGIGVFEIFICIVSGGVMLGMLALIGIGFWCFCKKQCSPQKQPTGQARDLENMLLRTSSSDSEGAVESDEDLIN